MEHASLARPATVPHVRWPSLRSAEGVPRLRTLPRLTVARHAARQPRFAWLEAGRPPAGGGTLLLICASGAADCRLETRRIRLTAGEALLVPGDCRLAAGLAEDSSLLSLWIECEGGLAAGAGMEVDRVQALSARAPALELLTGYCEQLLALDEPSLPLARLCADQLRALVSHLCDPAREIARRAPFSGPKAARLHTVLQEIHRDFRDPLLSVSTVAGRLGLTPRYVQQLMDGTGASFSTYLRNLRIDEALRLLQDTGSAHLPISGIAFEVGFQDLSYFNRMFRRRTCRTPSQVRRQA